MIHTVSKSESKGMFPFFRVVNWYIFRPCEWQRSYMKLSLKFFYGSWLRKVIGSCFLFLSFRLKILKKTTNRPTYSPSLFFSPRSPYPHLCPSPFLARNSWNAALVAAFIDALVAAYIAAVHSSWRGWRASIYLIFLIWFPIVAFTVVHNRLSLTK